MWFDETPRLLSVAEILKKKKNREDNYDRDDITDVKKQELTGKYDKNFDALGSDFERAHNYNLNNIQQPENTKDDVDYSDKYKDFLKYEPSTYVRLEEDEYKPFSKNDEKANEYYIDNLQGKTLDDLIISKMKENAGAEDLPRDAMRRKFANDLLNQELPSFNYLESTPEEELQEQREQSKQHKKTTLRRLNANPPQVVIEAPLSSSPRPMRSNRLQGVSAPAIPFSPEKPKRRGRYATKKDNKDEKNENKDGGGGAVQQYEVYQPTEEQIRNNPFIQKIRDSSRKTSLGTILQRNEERQLKTAFEKLKNIPKKKTGGGETKDSIDDIEGGGASGGGSSGPSGGKGKKEKDKDHKDDKDENKGGGKIPSKEEVRQQRADQAQARLEKSEEERINQLNAENRVKEYQTLIPKLNNYSSDRQLDAEDWAIYKALMKSHKHKTGNIPLASTAVKKLQEKLAESIKSSETSVKQNKLQLIQEDQTLAGNKLNFTPDLKNVKSSSKTPAKKDKESEESGSLSPLQSIQGMYSHNNPKSK